MERELERIKYDYPEATKVHAEYEARIAEGRAALAREQKLHALDYERRRPRGMTASGTFYFW